MAPKEPIENRILSLIFSAGRNFRQENNLKEKISVGEHLSLIQVETLKFIGEQKNPLMKDVADYLFITPPTLTALIDGLEEKKLIKRGQSQNDRRATLMFLTGQGRKIMEKNIKHKMEKMRRIFGKLTKNEQKTLVGILEKISASKE
jgi:DNA-binding MarR family transcriptional regulator